MKTKEKAYTAVVIAFAIFLLMGAVKIYFFSLQRLQLDSESVSNVHFALFCLGISILVLTATAVFNLKTRRLNPIATVIQATFLCVSIWGIPIGIWGFIQLRKSKAWKKADAEEQQTKTSESTEQPCPDQPALCAPSAAFHGVCDTRAHAMKIGAMKVPTVAFSPPPLAPLSPKKWCHTRPAQ